MEKHADSVFTRVWWRTSLAILCAILAQVMLNARYLWPGLGLYACAISLWLYDLHPHTGLLGKPLESASNRQTWKLSRSQRRNLLISLLATGVNIIATWGQDTFNWIGIMAWGISLVTFIGAFWKKKLYVNVSECEINSKGIRVNWYNLLFITIMVIGAFFRVWYLLQIPPEMTWDHTQKLLDIRDIVENGAHPLFFYRNTGREPLQFYWTALLVEMTGHPIDFTILKVGTVIVGLLTLPGIYLLAYEMFGRTVGLWAMGFTAIASWPVILSRTGLRYPFAPLFSAWTFYFLIRGWRKGERESLLLLGVCLGAGLYGYTAFRLIPLAVGYVWFVLRMTKESGESRKNLDWRNLVLVVVTAILVFVPLGTFAITHAGAFWGRSAWYLRDATSFAPLTYLHNIKNVLLMFNWRGDFMPLTTLPYEPVLDPILGGLFILGVAITIHRVVYKGDNWAFALILLGFVSLLPSALAINYPDENPSVVRTSCAIPIVYTLTALPVGIWMDNLFTSISSKKLKITFCIIVICLTLLLIETNMKRVFVNYPLAYRTVAPNTSEVANAVKCFDTLMGELTDTYIIAGPGWIDNDALAFELGVPVWQNTFESADLVDSITRLPAMYILHSGNTSDLYKLRSVFPTGMTYVYESLYDQDFVVYIVPTESVISSKLVTQQAPRLTLVAVDAAVLPAGKEKTRAKVSALDSAAPQSPRR